MAKEYDSIRMKLWADVWVAVSNSSTCLEMLTATRWADRALKEFDERFKNESYD